MDFTLDDIKRVYGESSYGWGDYSPMIELFGETLVQCDQHEYQGDTIAVIKKDDKYGYLTFGWGSCSGCDALQGCDSIQDVFDLAKDMWESITWYDSKDDINVFISTHDYAGDWTDRELVEEFKLEFARVFTEERRNP